MVRKSFISVFVILAFILTLVAPVTISANGYAKGAHETVVGELKTEYTENPLGIDVMNPRLSWVLESLERGQVQSAYKILVASSMVNLKSDIGDVWDTGKIKSDQSVNVEYKGAPLESGKRYYWKVKIWDKDGMPSDWSSPAWWEMGLLKPTEWSAKWISEAPKAQGENPTKYNVEMDFSILSDAIGIIFGYQNSGDFYMWQINIHDKSYAQLRPHIWRNGSAALLGPEINISSVIPEDKEKSNHHIKIAVDGSTINTYIDNVLVDTRSDSSFPFGKIGFRQCSDSNTDEIGLADKLLVTDGNGKVLFSDDFSDSTVMNFNGGAITNGALKVRNAIIVQSDPDENAAPYMRKTFNVSKPIKSARVYSTSLGLYELYINGKHVGNDALNPGWTDYNKRVQYQTFDVTNMLTQGDNALGAILGNGWYSGNVAMAGKGVYGTEPALLSQLVIEYQDGTTNKIVTDESWKSGKGAILYDDLLMGETYDSRKEAAGWANPGFDDSAWITVQPVSTFKGKLVAQTGPTVQVTQHLNTKAMSEPTPGTYIFDMGQNMVGWARLTAAGAAGTKITLRFGEMLNADGTLYTANLRSAAQTDVYILKGVGTETYEPNFTFHGFRYVEVTGYPGVPTKDAVEGVVAGSATTPTGTFNTSNDLVNQLQSNITWGQRGNFLSVPTDCPQRDERMGWMGDAQVFVRTATFNMDVEGFFTKWMQDVEDAQRSNGAFTDVAPHVSIVGSGNSAWADAGVIVPWTIYQAYGNTNIIKDNYDAMTKYIDYLKSTSPNLIHNGGAYGDWLSINANTPMDVLGTAYFAYSTNLMAKMAKVIGKTEDAQKYEILFNDIKAAFNKAFVTEDGHVKGNTQTCYLLALHMDLLPQDKRDEAAKYLVQDIQSRDWHLSTGFIGVGYLNTVLSEMGYSDVAYRLLTNVTYPSWGYSIVNGATTIWERWNSYTKENGFGDVGMNSFNHYSLGSVGEWMYRYVSGIDIDQNNPGYKHIIIQPTPGGGLSYANGSYDSPYGKIVSDWSIDGNAFKLVTEIPVNTTATVYLPADDVNSITESDKPISEADGVKFVKMDGDKAVFEVGSGSYSFTSILKTRHEVKIGANTNDTLSKVKVNGVEYSLPYAAQFKEGDAVTFEAYPVNDVDYTFYSWQGSANETKNPLTIKVDKNIDLQANFAYKGLEDLALGKKVNVSDNDGSSPVWSPQNLVDGLLISTGTGQNDGIKGYTSKGLQETNDISSSPKWIEIDLGKNTNLNQITLYPRTDVFASNGMSPNFPADFTIQVKPDGGSYTTVKTITDQQNPQGKPQVFELGDQNARYVKINVTKLGLMASDDIYYRLQLAEFAVQNEKSQANCTLNMGAIDGGNVSVNGVVSALPFAKSFPCGTILKIDPLHHTSYKFTGWSGNVKSDMNPLYIVLNDNITMNPNFALDVVNLALKKTATSNNSLESGSTWSVANLTDGTSNGYTCNGSTTQDVSGSPRWVTIDLGKNAEFNTVILCPRVNSYTKDGFASSFPVDFTIEVKPDGGDYSVVKTVTGETNPMGQKKVYSFDTQNARYIRINVTKLGPMASDDSLYRFQLSEIEVYNIK